MLYDDIRLSIAGLDCTLTAELMDTFGSAHAIFNATAEELTKDLEINRRSLGKILAPANNEKIEKELAFIERYSIRCMVYGTDQYPTNLAGITDPPTILYAKGDVDFELSPEKIIAIVGTRKCSPYGISSTERVVAQIAERHPDAIIVSGLAYGIDSYAHRAALKYGLKTVAVMAHGLDMIYPSDHRDLAKKIIEKGGAIVSEYHSESPVFKHNFLKRNRIIAGLSQSLILAESAERGGSMVTATLSDGYGREVFSFPARTTDSSFAGNIQLLLSNKANMLTSVKDIEYIMNWQQSEPKQRELNFTQTILSDSEQEIFNLFPSGETISADEIIENSTLPTFKIMSSLTSLEFKGLIKSVKGKMYIRL